MSPTPPPSNAPSPLNAPNSPDAPNAPPSGGWPRRRWLAALPTLTGMTGLTGLTGLAGLATGAPAAAQPAPAPTGPAGAGPRPLRFPADFGAHPDWRTEWWYVTGWLGEAADSAAPLPRHGFQLTFFRQRSDLARDSRSTFAARQLVFAHAAVTDLATKTLRHDQRIARAGFGLAEAAVGDTRVHLHAGTRWSLEREGGAPGGFDPTRQDPSRYLGRVDSRSAAFALEVELSARQPLLLQGDAGWSRKGPRPAQASFYYSQPQLAVRARLALDGGAAQPLEGRAWLDHEWSETLLDPEAEGWDWIGMNLFDGSALTAFRLRRPEGHPAGATLWAGGSWRPAGGVTRAFAADALRFTPLRHWTSSRHAQPLRYPVQWRVETPVGRFVVQALADDQELDSRASTGTVYWEGLSELLDEATGRRVGLGYLEMTGYAARLRL